VALAVLTATLTGAGGFLGGAARSPDPPAPVLGSITAGGLSLEFPEPWQRLSRAPRVEGLSGDLALAPGGDSGEGVALIAGQVRAQGAPLLSEAVRKRVGPLPEPDPVRLGRLAALRYSDLPLDARRATIYAVPTTGGVATLACLAGPAAADDAVGTCQRIASTLRLTRSRPYGLGPSPAFASLLQRTFSALNAGQARGREALRRAGTPYEQRVAAERLSALFDRATRSLASAQVSPAAGAADRAIVTALRRLRDAYTGLAQATRRRDRAAFAAAGTAVGGAQTQVRRSLGSLAALGYHVPSDDPA